MTKPKKAAEKSSPRKKKVLNPSKATAKPTVEDKINILESRIRTLEAALTEKNEQTITVNYEVKFFGGAGQIQFKGENIDRLENNSAIFNVEQKVGKQRIQVGGTAPEGNVGRIEVQVKQGENILSPFSENTYKKGFFLSQIFYTIK